MKYFTAVTVFAAAMMVTFMASAKVEIKGNNEQTT